MNFSIWQTWSLAAFAIVAVSSTNAADDPSVRIRKLAEAIKVKRAALQDATKKGPAAARNRAKDDLRRLENGSMDPFDDLSLFPPQVGSIGRVPGGRVPSALPVTFEVAQIVNDRAMHVYPVRRGDRGERMILYGISTNGMADGTKFETPEIIEVTGTEKYTTVLGASATCYVLTAVETKGRMAKIMELAGINK